MKEQRVKELGTNYYVQNKLQGYIIQHREYSQHSIMIINVA